MTLIHRALIPVVVFALFSAHGLAGDGRGELQLDEIISPDGLARSSEPSIAASGDRFFAAWEEAGPTNDIYFARSTDGGKSFRRETRLDGDDLLDDENPKVAADGDLVVVAWLSGSPQDVKAVVSTDGGASFGSALNLSGPLAGDGGDADSLRVVVTGTHIYVAFEDDATVPTGPEDVYAVASSDSGATFGNPLLVSDYAAGAFDADDVELAAIGSTAYVVWVDDRNTDDEVSFCRSMDGGLSWGANARLDSAGVGIDAHDPAIAAEGADVHVTWLDRRNAGGDQTFFTTSSDSGTSFGGDSQVGATPMTADADAPAIAVAAGCVYVVWADDRGTSNQDNIFMASSPDAVTFTEVPVVDNDGAQTAFNPRVVADGTTVAVCYQERSFDPGVEAVWMAHSTRKGVDGSFTYTLMSSGLDGTLDADSNQIAMDDQRELTVMWVDNRATGFDSGNDVYVNSLRTPCLQAELLGAKTQFHIDGVDLTDEGLLFLTAFSGTGTDYIQLASGLSLCLTPDSLTQLLLQPFALPLISADIQNGTASTVPIKFPFSGFAVGIVLDFNDPDLVIAATDPVAF